MTSRHKILIVGVFFLVVVGLVQGDKGKGVTSRADTVREFKQIATEGSTTVAGSKISWKEPLRMSDMRFPSVPLSLSKQKDAYRP